MTTYLVTGGCGFIGSHLCDYLLDKRYNVRVLDNLVSGKLENISSKVKFIEGDICDLEILTQSMEGVDGCFHLAAIPSVVLSTKKWRETHETNMTGMINIFQVVKDLDKKKPIPIVYASSAAVYGDNSVLPLKESSKTNPLSAYAADKLGCELHARVASVVHNISTVGLRFFNVFGPRQDSSSPYSGVISRFFKRIKENKAITIYGDGNQSRDFIYIDDVLQYLHLSMKLLHDCKSPTAKLYNVCTMKSATINQLANTISKLLHQTVEIHYKEKRIGEVYESLGDNTTAKKELHYSPKISLEQGLRKMKDELFR